jgi:vacuolar-type H+-ATPase subunit F/Vma7
MWQKSLNIEDFISQHLRISIKRCVACCIIATFFMQKFAQNIDNFLRKSKKPMITLIIQSKESKTAKFFEIILWR